MNEYLLVLFVVTWSRNTAVFIQSELGINATLEKRL